jgi:23S rRNA pseudouridine2605 synthase
MEERIQKLISRAGIASRRHAEEMIEQGRVTINGKRAQIGDKANPAKDDIRVDGTRLKIEEQRVYIAINKPVGVVSAAMPQEQEHRKTVRDLVPFEGLLYPVGRLDVDSEGLVLLTNDGELAQRLTHPRYEHPKVYEVEVYGDIPDERLDIWRRGVELDDGRTLPAEVKVLIRSAQSTWIKITMKEGRNRQIRRIGETLGFPVKRLIRTQISSLKLNNMKPGEWRYLSDSEIKALNEAAQSPAKRKPASLRRRPFNRAAFKESAERYNERSKEYPSYKLPLSRDNRDDEESGEAPRRPRSASGNRMRSGIQRNSPGNSQRSGGFRRPPNREGDRESASERSEGSERGDRSDRRPRSGSGRAGSGSRYERVEKPRSSTRSTGSKPGTRTGSGGLQRRTPLRRTPMRRDNQDESREPRESRESGDSDYTPRRTGTSRTGSRPAGRTSGGLNRSTNRSTGRSTGKPGGASGSRTGGRPSGVTRSGTSRPSGRSADRGQDRDSDRGTSRPPRTPRPRRRDEDNE